MLNSQNIHAWNKKSLIFFVINQTGSELPSFLFMQTLKCHEKHSILERLKREEGKVVEASLERSFLLEWRPPPTLRTWLFCMQWRKYTCVSWRSYWNVFLYFLRNSLASIHQSRLTTVLESLYLGEGSPTQTHIRITCDAWEAPHSRAPPRAQDSAGLRRGLRVCISNQPSGEAWWALLERTVSCYPTVLSVCWLQMASFRSVIRIHDFSPCCFLKHSSRAVCFLSFQ